MKTRLLSLFLLLLLLLHVLPHQARAAGDPDFAGLAAMGDASGKTAVEVLTPAQFILGDRPGSFRGKYCTFHYPMEDRYGLSDYLGNVCSITTTGAIEVVTDRIVAVLEPDDGWKFYDVNGRLLCDSRYRIGEFAGHYDAVTGEEYVWAEGRSQQDSNQLFSVLITLDGVCMTADLTHAVYDGKIPYCTNGLWGIKDKNGTEVLAPQFDWIQFIDRDTFIAREDGKSQIRRLDGTVEGGVYEELVYEELYQNGRRYARRGIMAKQNGKWGLLDHQGNLLIPCQYDSITPISGERDQGYLCTLDGMEYYLRDSDNLRVPLGKQRTGYSHTEVLSDELIGVYDSEVRGYSLYDTAGNLMPLQHYPQVQRIGNYLICEDNNTYSAFDLACRHVVQDAKALTVTEKGLVAGYEDRTVFYDAQGSPQKTIAGARLLQYGASTPFIPVLEQNEIFAIADADGNLLSDYSYVSWQFDQEANLMNLRDEEGWHLFGADGKAMIDVPLVYPVTFGKGMFAAYCQDGKYGFVRRISDDTAVFLDVDEGRWYEPGVRFCFNAGLMKGVGQGNFHPTTKMTRAMLVQVLYNLSGEVCEPYGFTDVKAGAWYENAVNWAAKNGVVNGTSKTTFSPNSPVTREQMVTILYRYAAKYGAEAGSDASLSGFADLDCLSAWAKEPMAWAVQNGVITGKGNGQLDPKGQASRAEIATVLGRFVRLMAAR